MAAARVEIEKCSSRPEQVAQKAADWALSSDELAEPESPANLRLTCEDKHPLGTARLTGQW